LELTVAESRTAETLKRKRDEIARSIASYEKKLAQARADPAHINAAVRIFEGEVNFVGPHVQARRDGRDPRDRMMLSLVDETTLY
jgi:hypothetical protein